jgi:hypothetical protein
MFLRSTVVEADPARLDDDLALLRDRVLPAVCATPGSFGTALMVNRPNARSVAWTFWGSRPAADPDVVPPDPLAAVPAVVPAWPARVEVWEVAELYRVRRAEPGSGTRITRLEYDLGDAELLVESYRASTVPAFALIDGFASAALVIDLDTGTGLSVVTFADRDTLEDSRRQAAEIRRAMVEKTHAHVTEVMEYDVVAADLRMPEQALG